LCLDQRGVHAATVIGDRDRRRCIRDPGRFEHLDRSNRHECVEQIAGSARGRNATLEIVPEPAAIVEQGLRHQVALELPCDESFVAGARRGVLQLVEEGGRSGRVGDGGEMARLWRSQQLVEQQRLQTDIGRDAPHAVDFGDQELRWRVIGAESLVENQIRKGIAQEGQVGAGPATLQHRPPFDIFGDDDADIARSVRQGVEQVFELAAIGDLIVERIVVGDLQRQQTAPGEAVARAIERERAGLGERTMVSAPECRGQRASATAHLQRHQRRGRLRVAD
jgi:hypothetical protein